MLTSFIILAIVLSILIGYKTRLNIGIFAMIFAYIIGAFFMDLKPKEIVSYWPVSIFFVIFAVSLFYNFASVNGTLEKLAAFLIKKFENYPYFLPYAIFLVSALIAAMGAGFYSVLAFMAPITFLLCEKTGLDRVGGAMAINYGALGGANFPTSQSGIIFRSLMEKANVNPDIAFSNAFVIFLFTFILPIFVISLFVFKAKKSNMKIELLSEKIVFDSKQKTTLILMALMMVFVLAFPLLHIAFPNEKTITFINSKIDIGLIAIVFVAISLLLKLGDEKQVIALIPWGTLIMICGVGILVSIATKAGVINQLSGFVESNVPKIIVPIMMMIIAAIMSLFSSTLGVVTPALFPLVPTLSVACGFSEVVLFTCIVIGAQASAISPFSSGGSLVLGAIANEHKDSLFKGLIVRAIPIGFIAALIAGIIVMNIF